MPRPTAKNKDRQGAPDKRRGVTSSDKGRALGINNAVSRVAQPAGVAIAVGVGPLSSGNDGDCYGRRAPATGALVTVHNLERVGLSADGLRFEAVSEAHEATLDCSGRSNFNYLPADPGGSLDRPGRINRPTRTAPGPDSHTIDDRSHMTRRDPWATRIHGFDILPHVLAAYALPRLPGLP
jgi:hypothetical protein